MAKMRLAVLDRENAAGGEAAAVAHALDLVDDRHRGIARPHEIGMQRMHMAIAIDGALRRDQRLRDDLAAENPLPAGLRAAATKQIDLDLLEIERPDQLSMAVGLGFS